MTKFLSVLKVKMPSSLIRRKSYTRMSPTGPVYVKSGMIRNRGRSGRGPYVLPALAPGKLYGYTVSAPSRQRYASLKIAMHRNSPLAVFRRLQVLARYLKRTSPGATRIILSNAAWVRRRF